MHIGTNVWPGYEPLYLARELGYFDDQPIHLVEHAAATEVIRAFRNGTIDAAALTLDEVLLLAQHGQNPRIVLVMDFSQGGDTLIVQSNGFNGKTWLTQKGHHHTDRLDITERYTRLDYGRSPGGNE